MSNEQNPLVVYNAPGNYNVTLIVSNIYGSDSLTIEDYITVDPETGINNQNISQVKIYPNPVKDMLMISYSEDIESMEILSISGQVIISHECDDKLLEIETSSLPDGIYFIRIKVGNEEVTRKIVKIK